ncbi:hypothetical protein EEB19_10205 [Gordonia sp. OPL2]|nr:hypothetical protein EEB19_10205 [Gordonia sp. OPL2]
MVTVNPHTYFAAGSACRQMAGDVSAQIGLLRVSLGQCSGMAGDYSEAQSWGGSYDTKTKDFLNSAQLLVNALENFGDVVNVAGHDWAVANYDANRDPNKGPRPVAPARSRGPLYSGATALPPTSVGSNGDGLDTDVPGLLEKIGIPVPNGDTGKLAKASTAWSDFASHDHISGASTTLQGLHDSFDAEHADDAQSIREHLQNLKGAATSMAGYASAMASPVSSHSSALGELRTSVGDRSHQLLIALGALAATVVVGLVLLTVFSGGLSLAGADEAGAAAGTASGAAMIAEAATAIRGLITGSRLLVVLAGAGVAGAGAFAGAHGLTAAGALEHLAMLTAETIDESDDSPKYVPSPKHDTSMPHHGRQGTPMDLSDEEAQEVLDNSVESGKQRYGVRDGKVYVFQPDGAGGYHGYPATEPSDVPGKALQTLRDHGDITTAQMKKMLRGDFS